MDLILWRHAEAEVLAPGGSDSERTLTKRGQRHAARMAQWLDVHLPESIRVLSSPALRCTQTADALGRNYKLRDELALNANVNEILSLLKWPTQQRPVLLVGHQPWIGELVSELLGSETCNVSVSKGSVIWMRSNSSELTSETRILVMQSPKFL
jgi:phosphohistidine phosphatase